MPSSAMCQPCSCNTARARVAKVADAQTKLKFADAAYAEAKGQPVKEIDGFKNINNDPVALARHGLEPQDLTIPGTKFQTVVFEKNGEVIVSFKGTDPGSMGDIKADYEQAMNLRTNGGPNAYYARAQEIAKQMEVHRLAKSPNSKPPHFVGHSLGGGLASAAAAATGAPATTFNAAGLHADTVEGAMSGAPVNAVKVRGEILTGLVNKLPGLPDVHATEELVVDPSPSFGRDVVMPILGAVLGSFVGFAAARLVRATMLHLGGAIDAALTDELKRAKAAETANC